MSEVVLAGVGAVTLSDVSVAHSSGAGAVHTFAVPPPAAGRPQKEGGRGGAGLPATVRGGKRAAGAGGRLFVSVVEEAKRRSVALRAFDTIQDLLDDVLGLAPTGPAGAAGAASLGSGSSVRKSGNPKLMK